MTVRDITVIGHRALHQPTKKVREVTDEVRELVADMFHTMEAADGVGGRKPGWRAPAHLCL